MISTVRLTLRLDRSREHYNLNGEDLPTGRPTSLHLQASELQHSTPRKQI